MTNWAMDVSGYDSRRWTAGGWRYDLPIDWQRARDEGGMRLAIMKSSEAVREDKAFALNWKGAADILPRAAYHFFRCNVDAIRQAEFVIDLLEDDFDPDTDYVILDFETRDGRDRLDCLRAAGSFLYEMDKQGITPLIYTYPAFWKAVGGEGATWAKRYPLALAQWPLDNWVGVVKVPPYLFTAPKLADLKSKVEMATLRPVHLAPWDQPALWQFTARADAKAIPGHPAVKRAVDYNIVYMPLPYLIGDPPTEPPLEPPAPAWLYRITVICNAQNVRSGPSVNYPMVALAYRDDVLAVYEVENGWGRISDTERQWVYLGKPYNDRVPE